jgi:hypothetical protein
VILDLVEFTVSLWINRTRFETGPLPCCVVLVSIIRQLNYQQEQDRLREAEESLINSIGHRQHAIKS